MALYEKRFRDLMDLKIFVMTDDDIRLSRRIQRDIAERGRTVEDVLAQYNRFVKTSYDEFIKPTMKYADIIIPHGRSNTVAIDFVVSNLKTKVPMDDFVDDFNRKIPPEVNDEDIDPENFSVVEASSGDKKIELLIKKMGALAETEEEIIMRDFYSESLLLQLFSMKTFTDIEPKRKFNSETQLFIPDILGEQGEQSALDFVMHGPSGKDLEIYTLVTKWSRVTQIIKNSGSRKLTLYRLKSIKDESAEAEDANLKILSASLKDIN